MAKPTKALKLYRKAEAALIASIEIYNKPDFAYREETFAILAINAWELLLKAKVLADNDNRLTALHVLEHREKADGSKSAKKYAKKNRAGNYVTVGLSAAIAILEANPKTRLPREVRGNLEALTEIRDNAVHYTNAGFDLAKRVLEVGTACVRNFVELAKKWFGEDLSGYSLYLMPIGFLAAPSASAINASGDEGKLVSYLQNLAAAQGAETSATSVYHIALDINLSFTRSAQNAVSTFTITNDPAAPHVYLTEEDIRNKYPWDYAELLKRCYARYSDFKENSAFQTARGQVLHCHMGLSLVSRTRHR